MQRRDRFFVLTAGVLSFFLLSGFGIFGHKKYETPISKDTLQPDKVLFDRAIKNIEHGDYEAARLTLNTLINTYDTSEYLAKAKLAIADSWYREGGTHGLAQAEAEYKDFILFYPNMEEAAESQYKICSIHYKQMDKADRDDAQGQRAEDECRQVIVQFPNSKFTDQARQMVRNVQEVLADKEFLTGDFYQHKGSFPAAAGRFAFVAQQYPLYSGADEALWNLSQAYKHMGDRFEDKEAVALTSIVKDYPLSAHAGAAKERLVSMKRPVPQADPAAAAREKQELASRTKPGALHRAIGAFETRPETYLAAKSGTPAMENLRPPVPVSVPATAAGGQTGVSDVVLGQTSDSAIDQKQDARIGLQNAPGAPATGEGEQKASVQSNGQPQPAAGPTGPTGPAAAPGGAASPATTQVVDANLPTNHPLSKDQLKLIKKAQDRQAKAQKKQQAKTGTQAAQPAAAITTGQPPTTTPTPAPQQ
jgi:outer membrane protein assembly factor BamD